MPIINKMHQEKDKSSKRKEGGLKGLLNSPWILALFLVAIGLMVFGQTLGFEFINLDDDYYVTQNEAFTWGALEGIKWTFTYIDGNWHPLTWLSLMLDYRIFGLEPYGYHLTNTIFHLLNGVLLFLFLKRFAGSSWRSFFVAALFLVHPLRAESVAWVTERKDVLSGFFFLTTLWAYCRYAQCKRTPEGVGLRAEAGSGPATLWYWTTVVSFEFGMLSKYMLVTMPFLFFLIDLWPLKRVQVDSLKTFWQDLIRKYGAEKWPFFILIIPSTVMAIVSRTGGSLDYNLKIPFMTRLLNSFAFYGDYLEKTFVPTGLSFYYPYPFEGIPVREILVSFFLLALITLLTLKYLKTKPYLAVGWLWFLGMLVPVIGWLHIGESIHSDRYSYLPHMGLFIALIWGGYDLLITRLKFKTEALIAVLFVVVFIYSGFGWKQTSYWKNIYTLNEYNIEANYQNHMAHHNLGLKLIQDGRYAEALKHFETVRKIRPNDIKPTFLVGAAKHKLGRDEEALPLIAMTIARDPEDIDAREMIAEIYNGFGRTRKAQVQYLKILEIEPENEQALYNLGNSYKKTKDYDQAVKYYRLTLAQNSEHHKALNNLANILAMQNKLEEAEELYRGVLALKPDHERAAYNLVVLLKMTDRKEEAGEIYEKFLASVPDDAEFKQKAKELLDVS